MPYGKRLQKFWDNLSEDEKGKIKLQSEALKNEYTSLQEVRKAIKLSQQGITDTMGINSDDYNDCLIYEY
jgi:hypothetical protein